MRAARVFEKPPKIRKYHAEGSTLPLCRDDADACAIRMKLDRSTASFGAVMYENLCYDRFTEFCSARYRQKAAFLILFVKRC